MLRHSAAPFAISIFLLSACSQGGDAAVVPAPTPPSGEEQPVEGGPAGGGAAAPDFTLMITSPPNGQTNSATSASKPRTLAELPENQDWTLIARSPDGRGGFIGLRFGDNGNGDSEHFTYDEATGELTLVKPVDFERPEDANRDSSFELQMTAHEYPSFPPIDFSLDVLDQKEIFEDHPVVWIHGEETFGGLGRNITSLGDLDADGLPDLAVAAPGRHQRDKYQTLPPANYHASGDAYLVSGEVLSQTTSLILKDTSGAGLMHIAGSDDTLNLGYNMALIPDLDGDQVDDFLISQDHQTIHVMSGAGLAQQMSNGAELSLADLPSGVISLEVARFGHKLDPRTLSPLGDLDGDGLSEIAFCATYERNGSTVEAHVFTLSGAALQGALIDRDERAITDLFETQQAAYYSYAGNHFTCGPLTAIGDVDGDDLMDIAIPMPGPQAGDSGILVFGGSQLLDMMQEGGRITISAFDRFFNKVKDPFVHFTDGPSTGTEQHFMVNALGDVTGDGLDDFSFSWARYQGADDSAYIVRGDPDLLSAIGETKDLRRMIASGATIQLAATPSNLGLDDARVEHVHALRAPEDGLHETYLFVGAGEAIGHIFESFILSARDLPAGGTSIVPLPLAGAGKLAIPRGKSRLLSYVTTVGDLNTDGYADLAIGWGTYNTTGAEDGGVVMLVSGKAFSEAHARGETFRPHNMLKSSN